VVGALLTRGLVAERITDSMAKADAAPNRIWRNDPDGRGVLLLITPAGLDAIGIEPTAEPEAPIGFRINECTDSTGEPAAGRGPTGTGEPPVEPAPKRRGRPRKVAPTAPNTAAPRKSRDNTKQAQMIAMLRRPAGATIAQIVEATGGSRTRSAAPSPAR
jgi:hypothetical protein